jgi:hypothetical protein
VQSASSAAEMSDSDMNTACDYLGKNERGLYMDTVSGDLRKKRTSL